MSTRLYVSWRDPIKRSWHPVGLLGIDSKGAYTFVYTKGAVKHGLTFLNMPNKWIYRSERLFPLFTNRIISSERPEFNNYLHWLDMKTDETYSPLEMLALTEGIKPTDNFEFFKCPSMTAHGEYRVSFLVHGLRYVPKTISERANHLKTGDRLFLMPDVQNPHDAQAIALRTDDPAAIVGYCPRYLSPDINELIRQNGPQNVTVLVRKVNNEAPLNLRLLCELVTTWPEGFAPCSDEEFEPAITSSEDAQIESRQTEAHSIAAGEASFS